ncbi:MAG: arylsulfatase [Verrucomicrobiales bacterium]|nr:arylsulfatase [Verrucomicrobiales bacterium]
MDFRTSIVTIGLSLATVISAAPKPSVLIILADDMGYSDLGCMGSEIQTPNIDRLAENGLLFTQAYNTSKCFPTRACLLTGAWFQETDREFSNTTTLGEALRPAGYRTLWSGKHHANFDPRTRGFDRFYGFLGGAINCWNPGNAAAAGAPEPARIEHYQWILDEDKITEPFIPDRTDWYATDVFTDKSIEWLEEIPKDDQPFLLYLAYNAPHWPLHAPKESIERCQGRYNGGYEIIREARYQRQIESGLFDAQITPLSPTNYGQTWDSLSPELKQRRITQMEVYAAMVERMDENIGRIIKLLDRQGRLENTIIFFLSDNGACTTDPSHRVDNYRDDVPIGGVDSYEPYHQGWANVSNTPLRNFKTKSHEGGISTPMIVHWPKGIKKPGRICREPVHLVDIAPTVASLAGAENPANGQGINIIKTFQNTPLQRGGYIYWEWGSGNAIRQGDLKLVRHNKGEWELYDLANDRSELNNLANQMPEKVKELSRAWNAWWKACTGNDYQ